MRSSLADQLYAQCLSLLHGYQNEAGAEFLNALRDVENTCLQITEEKENDKTHTTIHISRADIERAVCETKLERIKRHLSGEG